MKATKTILAIIFLLSLATVAYAANLGYWGGEVFIDGNQIQDSHTVSVWVNGSKLREDTLGAGDENPANYYLLVVEEAEGQGMNAFFKLKEVNATDNCTLNATENPQAWAAGAHVLNLTFAKLADNSTAQCAFQCQSGAFCTTTGECGLCPAGLGVQSITTQINTTGDNHDAINLSAQDFYADIYTNQGVIVNVETTFSNTNLGGAYGLKSLGKWVNVTPQGAVNLSYWILKIYYTDAEVAAFKESSLRISYYNETSGTWEDYTAPRGGVNTAQNYVWANLTHFSVYGIYGTKKVIYTGGGGGGGGGSYTPQETPEEQPPVVTPPVMPMTNPPADDSVPSTGESDVGMDVSALSDGPEQTGGSQITGGAVTEGLSTSGRTAAIVVGLLALCVGGFFLVRKWF